MNTDTYILEVKDLWKNFGRLSAVAGVSLKIKKKDLTAIIGPNGAGKSTFFNLITGKLQPSRGGVYFNGNDITGHKPYQIARLGISRTFQITNLFPELTVYENIRVAVLAKMKKTKEILILDKKLKAANDKTAQIIELIGLAAKQDALCGVISHGDQRLVEIGVALAIEPTLLLLDEPTGGMGPQETEAMVGFIRQLNTEQAVTILLVEHDMNVVFSVSERIVVMHQGMVIADGNPEEIRQNPKVREAYLGKD